MATYSWTSRLLALLAAAPLVFSSAAASSSNDVPPPLPPRSRDILVAIEEMTEASYFTFVTLINMTPPDLILGNVTFLMPDDRTLSEISLAQEDVSGFLLRHLISSPLLLDHLQHIPAGSIIPTSAPGYIMRIDNCESGTRNRSLISLNDVRVIRPNVCVAGSSIRCHGIGGVLPAVKMPCGSKVDNAPSCLAGGASANNVTDPIPPDPSNPLPPPSRSTAAPPLPNEYRRNSASPHPSGSNFLSVLQAASIIFSVVAGLIARNWDNI